MACVGSMMASTLAARPFMAGRAAASPHVAAGRTPLRVLAAKKGGGGGKKGGGGNKKGPGSLMNPPKPAEPFLQTPVIMQNLLLVESHFRKTGRPIFGAQEVEIHEVAKALWDAPFAVLAHDVEEGQPNRFCYGNKRALELFECTWDELVGTESTQSAEDAAEVQEDRAAALARAMEKGFIDDYSGWRKSFKGTRFQIGRTTLFNVEAPSGEVVGQAVTIREWEYEDGTKGGESADAADAAPAAAGPPTPEAIAATEAAVAEQAALVRSLKEEQGLSNSSEEVKAAVDRLLQLKGELQALQETAAAAAAAEAAAAADAAAS